LPGATSRQTTQIALFAALIAVSSFVAIPTGAVPFTFQVFAVLLAGLVLAPLPALACVAVYLMLGLVAPVYAGGASGIAALAGPTGGYLVGFLPAVLAVSFSRRSGVGSRLPLGSALLGLVPLYVLGACWLAWHLHLDVWAALTAGVLPFVGFDVMKALLAAGVARALLSLPLGLPEPPRES
jgi:biotin transport system substrate-specific component